MNQLDLSVEDKIIAEWQDIIDLAAEIIGVPAGLVMRLRDEYIEVFVSSKTEGNPYKPGDKEYFKNSGLYCETVINNKKKLLVPNALQDSDWKNNPDVKLNMISYLGYPLLLPDGNAFGTICVLDNKTNRYSELYEKFLGKMRDIIQGHLTLLYMNTTLGTENKRLTDYISEIKLLRKIIPICSNCKKVRDDTGFWHLVENYISNNSETQFSHGICPECMKKLYPEYI